MNRSTRSGVFHIEAVRRVPGYGWSFCSKRNGADVRLVGIESVLPLTAEEHYLFKAIANESGAIFFPSTTEHRDAGQRSIRYADNYEGSALAAMIKPGRVEFRYHKQFSGDRVRKIAVELLSHPALAFAATFSVTYQNRLLVVGGEACDARQ